MKDLMQKTTVTSVQEGRQMLQKLEAFAASQLRMAEDAMTDAMLTLYYIKESGLWYYAEDEDGVMFGDMENPQWESYLRRFTAITGIGRSSIYKYINTVQTWVALGRDIEQLRQVGIFRASTIRSLVRYDSNKQKLLLPSEELILPPGETLIDRINALIDETLVYPEIPLRPFDVKKRFTVDTGIVPDVIYYMNADALWANATYKESNWVGPILTPDQWRAIPDIVKEDLRKRLNVK